MNDAALFAAIGNTLEAGLARAGQTGVRVVQFNPVTLQGRPGGPALLFQKLPGDYRYGWIKREDVPDEDDPTLTVHREIQFYESTIQIEALGTPAPSTGTPLPVSTASDLVNLAAAIVPVRRGHEATTRGGAGRVARDTGAQPVHAE